MRFAKNTYTCGKHTPLSDELPAFHEHGSIEENDSELKVVILNETLMVEALPTSMAPDLICLSSALV